ncbi:MAG TPA: DUF302 domain-containing protein [Devosiaceae bacterium]|jgi:uncharacterized protein (DUF302 family)
MTDVVELISANAFDPTVRRIAEAIEKAGLTIFARIDHAAAAKAAGLEMPPTIVLIYGNARGGTPVMLAAPNAALELPLRVLIRADAAGAVYVVYRAIAETLRGAGVGTEMAARLEPAQRLIADAARGD